MKAGIAATVVLIGIAISSTASAQWDTTIQDDIFSGDKKAMLLGNISPSQAVAFDCDSDGLSLALLQEEKWADGRTSSEWKLLIKVDKGEIHRFTVESAKRNNQYTQYVTREKEEILKVLADLREAKSVIQLGLQSEEFDSKWSGTVSVGGSTRETDKFTQACKLK
ncbi:MULTISPECIES: hypothetical protein [Pseudomonas]|jgi:hypothetical protein|uniref:Uncharacterized protein n=1 Tax=Pseudomonas frederiksbergensis TaxID=104087 RepID=A0AB33E7B1_9PSED|nr:MULTISPECIES: hypothetical protein [Pseudomonas]ATE76257.1 hypothetical protein CNN82_07405 [Pseudomonas frederiksbergensis]